LDSRLSAFFLKTFKIITLVNNLQPAKVFLIAAVFFELLLNIVTPPLQSPDEFSHFYRAYQISEGHFLPEKTNNRLGGQMPQGIEDFVAQFRNSAYDLDYTLNHQEILNACKIDLQVNERVFKDFANTAYYSPVSYLPQALAITVLKIFTKKVGILYYGGRLFTFIVWLLCMCLAIKQLPVFKWLITFLLLLPMGLYQSNSFSADVVTNILSILFISFVLKNTFQKTKINWQNLLILLSLAALLVLAKVVYAGLVLLLYLIPAARFKNNSTKLLHIGYILFFVSILFVWWSSLVMNYYLPYKNYNPDFRNVASLSACGDYYAQKSYILKHGFYFFEVIYYSLFKHPSSYLKEYVGVFGNSDINMPGWIYVANGLLILFLAIGEKNKFFFSAGQKIFVFLSALAALVLLLLSQHLIWDCVGEGVVDLLQGRYLIPILPLLLILFDFKSLRLKLRRPGFLIIGLVFVNFCACFFIYQRYFVGKRYHSLTYSCDVEKLDAAGKFETTKTNVRLDNSGNQSTEAHRSGRYSALIWPSSPYCFTHTFYGLGEGDLIEVEAWEKGKGALIVLSGIEENCEGFYFGGTYNSYREGSGWLRIKNSYRITVPCRNIALSIYFWNPGTEKIYIDDIKTTIKKHPDH
jgi:uncharacterized membrane protein